MRKELIISSIPQETRVALVEDDELVEFMIERHRAHGIIGNIYKGRVTKVLPGMQSAFVDIGLERDAFLYVSDFVEDGDEYDRMVSTAEEKALEDSTTGAGTGRAKARSKVSDRRSRVESRVENRDEQPVPADEESAPESAAADEASTVQAPERPAGPRRTERRERRGRVPSFETAQATSSSAFQVLPGESLAKYRAAQPDEDTVAEDGATDMDATGEDGGTEPGRVEEGSETESEPEAPVSEAGAEIPGGSSVGTESEATESDELSRPAQEGATPRVESAGAGEHGDQAEAASEARENAEESDPNEQEGTARARITDPPPKARFSRRPSSRRSRRRQPPRSDSPDGPAAEEPKISDLLKAGQEILVQVSKEPLGKKGARITSHIALPGRYLVYMPTVDHVGVSRKISTEDERARLRQIINANRDGLPGGFIVRTAAEGRDEQEFVQDLRFLGDLWKEIREQSERTSAPAMIHSDLTLVERVLRDQLTDEFRAIRLDTEVEYARVLEFVSRFQPSLVNRVRLHLKDTPILEEYGLQQEIDKAMKPKVWLKSGGYIVVNQTEALVAIDVNTGKFVGKSNRLEDTIVRTNIDAVHEIVRQIRLRNLGGIIVVDFIDMEERKNRQRVMQALEEELRKDKSPSKSLQFNDFGLVAITRKRTQPSLERVLGRPCPRCAGAGYVKALETVCYEIQQEARKMLSEAEGNELTVRVSPEVAKAIKSGEFVDFTEMEEEARKDIRIQADPMLEAERFDIF